MTDSFPPALARFYLPCPKGVEPLLVEECQQWQITPLKQGIGGIHCEASWPAIYAFCLYTRFANRVIWLLAQGKVNNNRDVYHLVKDAGLTHCFSSDKTFSVECRGTNRTIRHSHYGSLLAKDAIADHFVEERGVRPSVDTENPDIKIRLQVRKQEVLLGIDLIGFSLHRRGYRLEGAKAPLKENLAAALVARASVNASDSRVLIDPMCGSGSLLIEGVLAKLGIASNLEAGTFVLEKLTAFNRANWQELKAKALEHKKQKLETPSVLAYGYDEDMAVLAQARANADRAGLTAFIEFRHRALKDFARPETPGKALLLTNPPYGERLGDRDRLYGLYQTLGEKCRTACQGDDIAILASDDQLIKALGLQKSKAYSFYNGALPVTWMLYHIYAQRKEKSAADSARYDQGVEMIKNRLLKNRKRLKKWLQKTGITAYRLYDADMPEYAFAVDCYNAFVQVAEYRAPKSVDPHAVNKRRQQFLTGLKQALDISDKKIILKTREQKKGSDQYEKRAQSNHYFRVHEQGVDVLVNLHDYLDTGLFLDHRAIRRYIGEQSRGKRFLNLFAYTSVATLHAVHGGAVSSASVDMSKTYQSWSLRNFRANGVDTEKHRLINDNCLTFVENCRESFDLIFLDPPSFSNSKKMTGTLDIQRDHLSLIEETCRLLSDDGVLIFSNNRKGFRLDPSLSTAFNVENFTDRRLDPDFEGNKKIHQCWLIRRKKAVASTS